MAAGWLEAGGAVFLILKSVVEGEGFEPPKHCAADLQSAPFGHLGTPPRVRCRSHCRRAIKYTESPLSPSPRKGGRA